VKQPGELPVGARTRDQLLELADPSHRPVQRRRVPGHRESVY
jgi:hypothetical protein